MRFLLLLGFNVVSGVFWSTISFFFFLLSLNGFYIQNWGLFNQNLHFSFKFIEWGRDFTPPQKEKKNTQIFVMFTSMGFNQTTRDQLLAACSAYSGGLG